MESLTHGSDQWPPAEVGAAELLHCSEALRRLLLWLLVAASLMLASCARPNYLPFGGWFYRGYTSTDVDASTVDVVFHASLVEEAYDLALYRCAEIALERGYQGFVVLRGDARGSIGRYTSATANVRMRMFRGSPESLMLTLGLNPKAVFDAAATIRIKERRVRRPSRETDAKNDAQTND